MDDAADTSGGSGSIDWRGIDFSGLTVVLGVGTGRLIELLNRQSDLADGQLLVVSYRRDLLAPLRPLSEQGPISVLQGRPRKAPILSDSVDLLVVNGVLREVPPAHLDEMCAEMWRMLVPGGRLRISDIIEPSNAEHNRAWDARNRLVRRLGRTLGKATALSVDLKHAAMELRDVGFEDLSVSILAGYGLTDAWLEQTINAVRAMASRVVERSIRHEIVEIDLPRLESAYREGQQRAAERFVLQGRKTGGLALDMEASFTESDLVSPE